MGDVVLFVDDFELNSAISNCRICHEAEFESCKSLEAPCACSGTVKVREGGGVLFSGCFALLIFVFVNMMFWVIFMIWVCFFLFSLLIEIVYRGGAMKKGIRLVKYVSRLEPPLSFSVLRRALCFRVLLFLKTRKSTGSALLSLVFFFLLS